VYVLSLEDKTEAVAKMWSGLDGAARDSRRAKRRERNRSGRKE
jgi:hypothetical protein